MRTVITCLSFLLGLASSYIVKQNNQINDLKYKAVFYDYRQSEMNGWYEKQSKHIDSLYNEIDSMAAVIKNK